MDLSLKDAPDIAPKLEALPVEQRKARYIAMANAKTFDFADFGTHNGAGLDFGKAYLNGTNGLGVEMFDPKVKAAIAAGYNVYSGDIMALPINRKVFKFAVCRHILEHMPNRFIVESVLWKLSQICSDFLYIEQPDFSTENVLNGHGLVSTAANLDYHTVHLTPSDFASILDELGLTNYLVGGSLPISSSGSKWIHSADAPRNSFRWKDGDLPKPDIKFNPRFYRDMVILVGLRPEIDLDLIAKGLPFMKVSDSSAGPGTNQRALLD